MKYYLYNKSIVLDFEESRHVYKVDDEIIPSVTGVLESVSGKFAIGANWAAKMCGDYFLENITPQIALDEIEKESFCKEMKSQHRKKSEKAGGIGTLVHDFASEYLLGKVPNLPQNEQARTACLKFLDWTNKNEIEVIDSESKVYSKRHKYAGTLDLDCVLNGRRTLLDFKTSGAIYPEMFIQVGGYVQAREEELGIEYEASCILRIPKDGSDFEVQYTDNLEKDVQAFLSAFNLFTRVNEINSFLSKRR